MHMKSSDTKLVQPQRQSHCLPTGGEKDTGIGACISETQLPTGLANADAALRFTSKITVTALSRMGCTPQSAKYTAKL